MPNETPRAAIDRRTLIRAAMGLPLLAPRPARAEDVVTVEVAADGPRRAISPLVYGSSEIGTADGGPPSATLDRAAGVTARRFGGNLTTTYNWTRNASNAGNDYRHANGAFLPDLLGLTEAERLRPAAAIEAMHRASIGMGAVSLVTLPLAGYVAADASGPVAPGEAAPSPRFVPVRWEGRPAADAPVDHAVADMPHLLARLTHTFGPADGATGIRAYALDNEPDLWPETHPRVVRSAPRIADLIERALRAARTIKAVDPTAWVFGPVSWGATGMASLQNAPDWPRYRATHGSFLAAYLDAFRQASEADGRRLLDALDVHWYPFHDGGPLFRTEDPTRADALLDAPRSLDERGFRERSWVASALPVSDEGLALPILPSLDRLAARWFPGTRVALTEFNYGGQGQLASGLALADALGRIGRSGVLFSAHWGALGGWLGQAYRLYRDCDGAGTRFGGEGVPVRVSRPDGLSAFAAHGAGGRLHVVLVNRGVRAKEIELVLDRAVPGRRVAVHGFDAGHPVTGPLGPGAAMDGRALRLAIPARAARHLVVAG